MPGAEHPNALCHGKTPGHLRRGLHHGCCTHSNWVHGRNASCPARMAPHLLFREFKLALSTPQASRTGNVNANLSIETTRLYLHPDTRHPTEAAKHADNFLARSTGKVTARRAAPGSDLNARATRKPGSDFGTPNLVSPLPHGMGHWWSPPRSRDGWRTIDPRNVHPQGSAQKTTTDTTKP
jgi:hypothetical protein